MRAVPSLRPKLCVLLVLGLLAARAMPGASWSGMLYIKEQRSDREIVVISNDGFRWLLLRDPDSPALEGRVAASYRVARVDQFAINGRVAIIASDNQSEVRWSAWQIRENRGIIPRKTLTYWSLILLGGLASGLVLVQLIRLLFKYTDDSKVSYFPGPPPSLAPSEQHATVVPSGWRPFVQASFQALLALLGTIVVGGFVCMAVLGFNYIDLSKESDPGVILHDMAGFALGTVFLCLKVGAFAGQVGAWIQLVSLRLWFILQPKVRVQATLRFAGDITVDEGDDDGISSGSVIAYAYRAESGDGDATTFVAHEAVVNLEPFKRRETVEVEYLRRRPAYVRRSC